VVLSQKKKAEVRYLIEHRDNFTLLLLYSMETDIVTRFCLFSAEFSNFFQVNVRAIWLILKLGLCSELLDDKKRTKLRWLRNPRQTNGDNLNGN